MTSPYGTNFHKGDNGNSLHLGEDLVITIFDEDKGEPIYASGVLWKEGRPVQLEQTGHRGNPSKQSLTFEMRNPDGTPFPAGIYKVDVRANFGQGDLGWSDEFQVV